MTVQDSSAGPLEDERGELRAAVRTLLERQDSAVWDVLAGQVGATGLMVPERYGGAGATLREACVVVEELGARLAAPPYLSSAVLATGVLLACGDEDACADLLPDLAAGTRTCALAWLPGMGAFQAGPGVSGEIGPIPDAAGADVLLLLARTPDGPAWFAVERADAEVTELTPVDLTRPLARVRAERAQARRIRGDARRAEEHLVDLACTALAAEQVGGAAHCLDATVAYVRTREQFGRPIGSFQAVKHRLADLAAGIEQARSLALDAADAVAGHAEDATALAAAAASLCGETYRAAAAEMLQLHGGIGFTWEHDAHRYLKRAHADACLYGTPAGHRRRLATMIR